MALYGSEDFRSSCVTVCTVRSICLGKVWACVNKTIIIWKCTEILTSELRDYIFRYPIKWKYTFQVQDSVATCLVFKFCKFMLFWQMINTKLVRVSFLIQQISRNNGPWTWWGFFLRPVVPWDSICCSAHRLDIFHYLLDWWCHSWVKKDFRALLLHLITPRWELCMRPSISFCSFDGTIILCMCPLNINPSIHVISSQKGQ